MREQSPQDPLAFTCPPPCRLLQRGVAAVTRAAHSPGVHTQRPVLLTAGRLTSYTGTLEGLRPGSEGTRVSVPWPVRRLSRLSPASELALPPRVSPGQRRDVSSTACSWLPSSLNGSRIRFRAAGGQGPRAPPPKCQLLTATPAPRCLAHSVLQAHSRGSPLHRTPSELHTISAPFWGSPDEAWPTSDCPPFLKSLVPRQGLGLEQTIPGQSQAAPHPREAILQGHGAIAEGSVWPAGATCLGIAKQPPGEEGAPRVWGPCRPRVRRGPTRGLA